MDEWALVLNDRIIKRFDIEDGQSLTIGRGEESDIIVDNGAISRQHCSLELINGVYYLTDLYSLNGTKVNYRKIESAVPIKKTDFIEVSKFILQPTETIQAEETAESYAVAADDGLDQTVFITAKSKHKPRQGRYILKVISGKASPRKLSLTGKNSVKIGKDSSCDIVISGFLLGKTQFYISRKANNLTLIPSGGFRKTYLNGKAAEKETQIKLGDTIRTGGITFAIK